MNDSLLECIENSIRGDPPGAWYWNRRAQALIAEREAKRQAEAEIERAEARGMLSWEEQTDWES